MWNFIQMKYANHLESVRAHSRARHFGAVEGLVAGGRDVTASVVVVVGVVVVWCDAQVVELAFRHAPALAQLPAAGVDHAPVVALQVAVVCHVQPNVFI